MTNDERVQSDRSARPHANRVELRAALAVVAATALIAGCGSSSKNSSGADFAGKKSPQESSQGAADAKKPAVTVVNGNPGRLSLHPGQQLTVQLAGLDLAENFVEPLRSSAPGVVAVVKQSPVYVGSTTMTASLRGGRAGTATLTATTRPLCACKGKPSRLTVTVVVGDSKAG